MSCMIVVYFTLVQYTFNVHDRVINKQISLDIFRQKRKPSNYLTLCTFTISLWNVMFRLQTHEFTFGTPIPKGISWSEVISIPFM
jgi:hypothetical protein